MENYTYKCVPVPSMVEIGKNKTSWRGHVVRATSKQ